MATVRVLMAVIACTVASSASAETWVKLTEGATGFVDYYDQDSIVRVGNNAKIWILSDHSNDPSVPYARAKRMYSVKCDQNVAALAAYLSYRKDRTVLENETIPERELDFQNVSPGSVGGKILAAACSGAPSGRSVANLSPNQVGGQTQTPIATSGVQRGIFLWKNFRVGMSADEAVTALASEGATSKVKINKKTGIRAVEVSGKTREKFVQIGDVRFEPTLGFSASGLRYLALDGPGSCDPIEASKLQTTYENLIKEKYPTLIAQTGGFNDVTSSLSRTFRRFGNDDVHVDVGLDAEALSILTCVTLFRVRLNYQSADDSLAALARQKKDGEQAKTNTLDDL